MGFFSKIKEAILGESVEYDNDNLLNEDMELNEAEALDEDYDALDEEMDYVDEALAAGDTIRQTKALKREQDWKGDEKLIGKQPHGGAKPLFIEKNHTDNYGEKTSKIIPYKGSGHHQTSITPSLDNDDNYDAKNTKL